MSGICYLAIICGVNLALWQSAFYRLPLSQDQILLKVLQVSDLTQGRRRRREAIAQAAQDCNQQLQLYLPGSQLFPQSEATSSALQRHLVRTLAQPLLDWLLRYQASVSAQRCASV